MAKSVTIAVPTYKNIPSMFFMNFLALQNTTKQNFKTGIISCDNTYIENARNTLVDLFLKNPYDCLFFLDSDMLVPPNVIEKLAESDNDVVSGIYFGRSQQGETHAMASVKEGDEYKRITSFPQELIEVDAVGLGCCLIKKEVIIKIHEKIGDKPLFMNKFESRTKFIGEDFYFCELLKENGYKIFVDPAVQCGHIGGVIDVKYYLANK